jgi:hypothetical protein
MVSPAWQVFWTLEKGMSYYQFPNVTLLSEEQIPQTKGGAIGSVMEQQLKSLPAVAGSRSMLHHAKETHMILIKEEESVGIVSCWKLFLPIPLCPDTQKAGGSI